MTPGGGQHRYKWTEVLKDLPAPWTPRAHSRAPTPSTPGTEGTEDESWDEKEEMRKREKRRKRKKAEIYVRFSLLRFISEVLGKGADIFEFGFGCLMCMCGCG